MIRTLCSYYDILADSCKGKEIFPSEGYSKIKADYVIFIREDGAVTGISEYGKEIELPERTEKSGIDKNFIEHRPLYIFGLNCVKKIFTPNDKTNKAKKSHEMFVNYNLKMTKGIDSEIVNAYRNFILTWKPENEIENPYLLGIKKYDAKYCFALDGHPEILLHEDSNIREIWDSFFKSSLEKSSNEIGMCSVLGEEKEIARIHKKINAISGGTSTGGVFIGVNKEAEESYCKTQAFNCNISVDAMKKYVSVINYLLSDSSHHTVIGDMTLIYWSMSENDKNEIDLFNSFLGNTSDDVDSDNINNYINSFLISVKKGTVPKMDNFKINEDAEFYLLGITPNSSRISVKLFYKNTFGNLLRSIIKHQEDLSFNENIKNISIKKILKELISPKSSNEKVSSPLEAAILKAALSGGAYPDNLLEAVIKRVRTDSDTDKSKYIKLNAVRAGIIKACLNRKRRLLKNKEEITMALDKSNTSCGYLCGRLFAVLELIQKRVNPNLNRTIKDVYFSTACSSPNITFNKLMKLSVYHQAKLEVGAQKYFDSVITEIMGKFNQSFPNTLSIEGQGDFIIGYYQQRNEYYTPSEKQDKNITTKDNKEE